MFRTRRFQSPAIFGASGGGGGGYVGPGDIYAFVAWYGLRAYNAAYAVPGTNPAVDLVDQAGANPITIAINTSGDLDVASINAWVTAHSVTTIKVAKLYDQVSTRHVSQATLGNMPTLVLNAAGPTSNRALMETQGIGQHLVSTVTLTQAAPLTVAAVVARSASSSGYHGFFLGDDTNAVGYGFENVANTAEVYNSGAQNTLSGVTDGVLHSMQYLATTTGAGTFITADGVSSTASGNITSGWSATVIDVFGSFTFNLWGNLAEVGIAAGNQTASNASMRSNQKTYWNTP